MIATSLAWTICQTLARLRANKVPETDWPRKMSKGALSCEVSTRQGAHFATGTSLEAAARR